MNKLLTILLPVALLSGLAVEAEARSFHEKVKVTPLKEGGQTVGIKVKLTLRPESYSNQTRVRVGLGPAGGVGSSYDFRDKASNAKKGHLLHQFAEVKGIKGKKAIEKTFEVRYADAKKLKPGTEVEVITAWSDSSGGYWHVWGMKTGISGSVTKYKLPPGKAVAAKPKKPAAKPTAAKPKKPAAKPRSTAAKPKKPAAKPKKPAAKPRSTAATRKPAAKPTAAKPKKPAAKPRSTAATRKPAAKPTAAKPKKPAAKPRSTAAKPKKPAAKPRSTAAKPKKPAAKPRSTAAKPKKPATTRGLTATAKPKKPRTTAARTRTTAARAKPKPKPRATRARASK